MGQVHFCRRWRHRWWQKTTFKTMGKMFWGGTTDNTECPPQVQGRRIGRRSQQVRVLFSSPEKTSRDSARSLMTQACGLITHLNTRKIKKRQQGWGPKANSDYDDHPGRACCGRRKGGVGSGHERLGPGPRQHDLENKGAFCCAMHGLGIMELYTKMARPRIGPWEECLGNGQFNEIEVTQA